MVAPNGKEIPPRILKLLKKLKELADPKKNPNEFEAASSAAKMQKILLEYNLSIDFISLETEEEGTNEDVTKVYLYVGSTRPENWVALLLNSVCSTFYCRAVGYGGGRYEILGSEVDITVTKFTFDYLHETVRRLAEKYANYNPYGGNKKTIKNSYSVGAVVSIVDTLNKMARENEEKIVEEHQEKSGALVLLKQDKIEKLDSYIKKEFPKIRNKQLEWNINSAGAYHQGKADGRNINIARGGGISEPQTKGILK